MEDEYRAKLAYKEQELDSQITKLARISQSNLDLKSRCDRLEASSQELLADLESSRARISSLEMELELTRAGAERDSEKLSELREEERRQSEGAISTLEKQAADLKVEIARLSGECEEQVKAKEEAD